MGPALLRSFAATASMAEALVGTAREAFYRKDEGFGLSLCRIIQPPLTSRIARRDRTALDQEMSSGTGYQVSRPNLRYPIPDTQWAPGSLLAEAAPETWMSNSLGRISGNG